MVIPDSSYLRYFYAVASSGNVTRAARELRISQPAVSKMIRQLEAQIGLKLFYREPRRMVLTAVGRDLYRHCQTIFDEYKNVELVIQQHQRQERATLRLGTSDNIMNYILPEVIGEVHRIHPGWALSLTTGTSRELKSLLQADLLDSALFYTPLTRSDEETLEATEIGNVPFVLIVLAKSSLRKFDREALSQMTYIGPAASDLRRAHRDLKFYQRSGIRPEKQIESNNQDTQKTLVRTGVGFAFVAAPMVQPQELGIRVIPTPSPIVAPVYHVRKRRRIDGEPVREFLKFLLVRLSKI